MDWREEVLKDYPELVTAEEREDWEHFWLDHDFPTVPEWWQGLIDRITVMRPEAQYRKAFEARLPALGLTAAEIDSLETHSQNPQLLPVQSRIFFWKARTLLLTMMIPVSGCTTVPDLCRVLRAELSSGIPSPVPDWYVFNATKRGFVKCGYDRCDGPGCQKTESFDVQFLKCSQCKLVIIPCFCSRPSRRLCLAYLVWS